MGIQSLAMESRSRLRGLVGLAVLAMCLVLARASLDELEGSQVQTLEEDLLEIGERLGGMAGNGTQAPANATGVATGKNATEPAPKTARSAELQAYIAKTKETLKKEGKNCDDATIETLARNLMIIDEAEKDTPRMRQIARELRTKGPKVHRVEVDDKQWAETQAERKAEAKAKQVEEAAQVKKAADAAKWKAEEGQMADKMIEKYKHQTENPKLDEQIEDAKGELETAHDKQANLFEATHANEHDPYGIVDKTKWGPPKKKKAGAESGTGTTATVAAAAAPAPAPAPAAAAAAAPATAPARL